jgi:hypothetical protein
MHFALDFCCAVDVSIKLKAFAFLMWFVEKVFPLFIEEEKLGFGKASSL